MVLTFSCRRSFGCGSSNPGVVARISEGYDWIRFVVCENAASPPSYLNCASATDPNIQPPLTPPAPINPIDFQFTFTTDDFSFEYGMLCGRRFAIAGRPQIYISSSCVLPCQDIFSSELMAWILVLWTMLFQMAFLFLPLTRGQLRYKKAPSTPGRSPTNTAADWN